MNGKLKLVLKLPKSLQQDNNASDTTLVKPAKKRKRPEGDRSAHDVTSPSFQKTQRVGDAHGAAKASRAGASGAPLPEGANGARSTPEGAAEGQSAVKPRLHIK
jgi:hypothetical protein